MDKLKIVWLKKKIKQLIQYETEIVLDLYYITIIIQLCYKAQIGINTVETLMCSGILISIHAHEQHAIGGANLEYKTSVDHGDRGDGLL